ncbi:MAG: ABC transporter ATP-binding protein [Desulfamplus sp.]|nr:ABC transporter ATP-binding protein [Desulfamplus sp.]
MGKILEVRDLVTKFYTFDGVVHALSGVSFDLNEGETLGVVGESGSGKSVTMMSLLHLLPSPPARIEGGQALYYGDMHKSYGDMHKSCGDMHKSYGDMHKSYGDMHKSSHSRDISSSRDNQMLKDSIKKPVRGSINETLKDSIKQPVRGSINETLKDSIDRPIKEQIKDAPIQDIKEPVDLLKLDRAGIRSIRGGKIGFIFQDALSALNPVMIIGRQIGENLVEHLGMGADDAKKRVLELLEYVGIPNPGRRYSCYPHQFSGGMRQRIMIALAIACNPRIIIADEPTTALDVTVQAQIIELVQRLTREMNIAVIWITHDLGVVAGMADRVLVMYAGTPVEIAPVNELYTNPAHPYTIKLLGALPIIGEEADHRLESIDGTPPDLLAPPVHCQFAWRCPHAAKRCWQEIPEQREVTPGHHAACFNVA